MRAPGIKEVAQMDEFGARALGMNVYLASRVVSVYVGSAGWWIADPLRNRDHLRIDEECQIRMDMKIAQIISRVVRVRTVSAVQHQTRLERLEPPSHAIPRAD